jgi:hypothetical protein
MSELMQLLTGAKPFPIPACAIRPMPLTEASDVDDDDPCHCSKCERPNLTEKDFYLHPDGRLYSHCKRCFCAAKNAKRRAKCA